MNVVVVYRIFMSFFISVILIVMFFSLSGHKWNQPMSFHYNHKNKLIKKKRLFLTCDRCAVVLWNISSNHLWELCSSFWLAVRIPRILWEVSVFKARFECFKFLPYGMVYTISTSPCFLYANMWLHPVVVWWLPVGVSERWIKTVNAHCGWLYFGIMLPSSGQNPWMRLSVLKFSDLGN